jgi:hypothetical protein
MTAVATGPRQTPHLPNPAIHKTEERGGLSSRNDGPGRLQFYDYKTAFVTGSSPPGHSARVVTYSLVYPIGRLAVPDVPGVCAAYGRAGDMHTHHLVPRAAGGLDLPTVKLCPPCHGQVHGFAYPMDHVAETRVGLSRVSV